MGWSIQHAKDQPTMALVEPADMSSIVKAMDDGKGWAHDDENGNFEVLSSRSHLLSLMRSSIWIIGFNPHPVVKKILTHVEIWGACHCGKVN